MVGVALSSLQGGQKCKNLLSKKTTKVEGGGHKIEKMGRRC